MKRTTFLRLLRFAVPLALSVCLWPPLPAQQAPATDVQKNPFSQDPAAIAAGRKLYEQTCQACHGSEARGDRGPALATGKFQHGGEDTDLFRTIRTGIPGTQMPAFTVLPSDDIWRIITYLRSLNTNSATAGETVPGDRASGKQIFWGKGGCAQCHEVNARGADIGPDLSDAGKNSAAYLREIILNPNVPARGARRWFGSSAVRIKLREGEVAGIKRAEDNYTLIMTDLNGKLRILDRKDILDEQGETKSLMPGNYSETLSSPELQDLVAYLKTLKSRDLSETIKVEIPGGLTFERLRHAKNEPQNWLTYWNDYHGHHFSSLSQITPANAGQLQAQWSLQLPPGPSLEATPLVVDGVMYTTYTTATAAGVYALDAKSGLVIWKYERAQKITNPNQINPFNRGVAMLGNRLFLGTLDAALVALDARTGRILWETQVADTMTGHSLTGAPLALKDKIIVGVAGGEFGIRGFIDAYDPATGKRLWRFNTIPAPGEFGNNTWAGDSWKRGSGAAWLTGSYDPDLNLLYWTVGNPGPSMNAAGREGDNLFTCSVVALNPDTGERVWHYQFTPGDSHDWDANEDVVLADGVVNGVKRKLLLQTDRNGMFYVLDRTNGKFIFAKPYVKQTWNNGFQSDGRPIFTPNWQSSPKGNLIAPLLVGGTNWQSPSYDAARSMYYVVALDGSMGYRTVPVQYEAGREYLGGAPFPSKQPVQSSLLAMDATNGSIKWTFPLLRPSLSAGVLATTSGLVFVATGEGNLIALDAQTGKSLWHFQTGGSIASAPISYAIGGRQYVAISAANSLYAFALPE
ncbi:MAG: PQQ-dependent dehydrogenase, methanol/ethanol family [Acidobacteriaceae bacterium]